MSMDKNNGIRLKILIPSNVFLEEENVSHLIVDTTEGSVGILPRRLDFVAILEPGILIYEKPGKEKNYLVHDIGVIIKTGKEVFVSTHKAIKDVELGNIKHVLFEKMQNVDQKEQHFRTIIAELESDITAHLLGV